MGFNIGNFKAALPNFGEIGKSVLQGVIKTVAPEVTNMLKKVADGFIDQGAGALKGAFGKNPLVNKLLGGLVDKLASSLKGLVDGALDKALKGLTDQPSTSKTENGTEVTKPGMSDIGNAALMKQLQQVIDMLKGGAQPAGSANGASGASPTGQAASAGGSAPASSSGGSAPASSSGGSAPASSSGGSSGASPVSQGASSSGGGSSGVGGVGAGDATSRGGGLGDFARAAINTNTSELSKDEAAMVKSAEEGGASPAQINQMKAQFKLQKLQELMQFISNYMKKMNEISMSIIQNMK